LIGDYSAYVKGFLEVRDADVEQVHHLSPGWRISLAGTPGSAQPRLRTGTNDR
jgi:hypothetical protein